MAQLKRRYIEQLPAVHQTDTLKKFFGATVDQLFQPGHAEPLSGFIGQKPGYYNAATDFYIAEPTPTREKYQLEAAMVSLDANGAPQNVLFYDDIINQLRFQGALVNDETRLFESDYYSWAPAVDLDKLLNFRRYKWSPTSSADDPQYVVMERGARDENPWSRANHWYHENDAMPDPDNAVPATRPILEFYANIKLWNYGSRRRPDVQTVFMPSLAADIAALDGQPLGTATINGRVLLAGDRILVVESASHQNDILRVDDDAGNVRLSRETDGGTGDAERGDTVRVTGTYFIEGMDGWDLPGFDTTPWDDSLAREFWFDGTQWRLAQQRSQDQQAPLFDLYDNDGVALNDPAVYPGSTFAGNKLFGYAAGDAAATPDSVLGFPLKHDTLGDIVMENFLVTQPISFTGGDLKGYRYYCVTGTPDRYVNDWHLARGEVPSDIPLNLQANPTNEEIAFIARNQWFDHFVSIIGAQSGFSGYPFADNNWRTTAKDLSLGTKVLQHRAPMLKLMLLASTSDLDIMLAIRYNEREYVRFKNKVIQRINDFYQQGMLGADDPPEQWVAEVLASLSSAKNAEFPFRLTGMAGDHYIPATAAFLGITPLYAPLIYHDDTFGVDVLRGHDGSIARAFGDFRDGILLALEQQIYDSTNDQFKTERRLSFDLARLIPGKWRTTPYSRSEFLQIVRPMFERWATQNQLQFRDNTTYVPEEPFTYNYHGMVDSDGVPVPGQWRGMYRWFYDTPRPDLHPWEMLGFASQPAWWTTHYGSAPFSSANAMWSDLAEGRIVDGPRVGVDADFARPGMIIPVDIGGNLLDPIALGLVAAPTVQIASAPWHFGDGSPVEDAWITSESYPFALAQAGYLMKPARFVEECWNPAAFRLVYPDSAHQWIDGEIGSRPRPSDYTVHGETLASGELQRTSGLQVWLSDYVISRGQNVTTVFGDRLRGLSTRLAHKMAGFTTTQNLQVRAENIAGPLPAEDTRVLTYQSPSIREEFYSAVIVEWTGNGYRVFGYDVLDPAFSIIPPDPNGLKGRLSVGADESTDPFVNDWHPATYYSLNATAFHANTVYVCATSHMSGQVFEAKFWTATDRQIRQLDNTTIITYRRGLDQIDTVPYGTEFRTVQEVADFLFSYERYLVSRGWAFDDLDGDTGDLRDWNRAVKEFLFWNQMAWSPGNFIALSPASARIKYVAEHGIIENTEQLINGVYALLDRGGRPIDSRNTFVSRLDGELTIIPKNSDLFGARLYISEIEHILVFSNVTIFNDIIYQPLFNLRQPRLRISGQRTTDWRGRLDAPGFIITANSIVPNFEKAPEDIRHAFDIEQPDNATYASYARHVIGYQSRSYLSALMFTETPQFEFYQGMIQQKGAPGVFHKLLRSNFVSSGDLEFLEEWAIRIGDYGAIDKTIDIEFQLQQSDVRRDPQLIQFWKDKDAHDQTGDSPYDDRIELIDGSSPDARWVVRPASPDFFALRPDYSAAPAGLPTAGYVRLDEVTYTVPTFAALADLYTTQKAAIPGFGEGDTIWIFDRNGRFDVVRLCDSAATINRVVSCEPAIVDDIEVGAIVTLEQAPALAVGDHVLIAGDTNSLIDLGGFRVVAEPPAGLVLTDQQVFIDADVTTGYDFSADAVPGPVVYRLHSTRYPTSSMTGWNGWRDGDLRYVENDDNGRWAVQRFANGVFTTVRRQPKKLDTRRVVRGLVYSSKTLAEGGKLFAEPLIIDRIIVYDPVGGVIPGVAERELDYKLEYDPAKYNAGTTEDYDPEQAWGDEHVGRLWWDLSTVRYLETELNDLSTVSGTDYDREIQYRIAQWGKLAPGTSIDIYEWVKSTVSPLDWTTAADNATGDQRDTYSGTVLNAETPAWVEQSDPDTNRPVYYFWVKNRTEIPALRGRKRSALAVAQILTNPGAQDIAWLAPVAQNSVIVAGVQPYLNDVSTIMQITARTDAAEGVAHRQWMLMRSGDISSQPNNELWRKLRDSLVGHDHLLQPVPDPSLHPSMRYGNYLRPRQSWFIDNYAARRTFVDAVNLIFSRTDLLDERPDYAALLSATTPIDEDLIWLQDDDAVRPLPVGGRSLPSDEWNVMVTDYAEMQRLVLSVGDRVLLNGLGHETPNWSVWVCTAITPNAFELAKAFDHHVADLAARDALTPSSGARVLVDGNDQTHGFWTLWRWSGTAYDLVKAQTYDTGAFWTTADWYATGYSAAAPPTVRYPTIMARNLAQTTVPLVRIDDDGGGRWIWTAQNADGWITVAKQGASAALSADFADRTKAVYGFDHYDLDTIPDRDGTWELMVLADRLRSLLTPLELNELFFIMLNYVHVEQDQVDWAFKTSFMVVSAFREPLTQTPIALADQTENLLDFINEIKPYHVKIRDFRRRLVPDIDIATGTAFDFDRPVYYDPQSDSYRILTFGTPVDLAVLQNDKPWKFWTENYLKTGYDYSASGYDPAEYNPVRRLNVTLGPLDEVPTDTADPNIKTFYNNWAPGAPRQMVGRFVGDGATDTFALGQIPQTAESVLVFVDGVHAPDTDYTLDFMHRTLTFTSPPPADATILVHTFSFATLEEVVHRRLFEGDGSIVDFDLTNDALGAVLASVPATDLSGFNIIATVEGEIVPHTVDGLVVTLDSAPPVGALVAISVYKGAPTLVHRSEQVFGGVRRFAAPPWSGTISAEVALIVEVNGRRLAGPEFQYVSPSNTRRVTDLNSPVADPANVTAWDGTRLMSVGHVAGWDSVADIDLDNIPASDVEIAVVDDHLVFIGFGTEDAPAGSYDGEIVIRVVNDNDPWRYDADSNEIVLNEALSLNDGDRITLIGFENADVMGLQIETHYGHEDGNFITSQKPWGDAYFWLCVQKAGEIGGRRLLPNVDFTIEEQPTAWDETPWEEDFGWDNVQPNLIVRLTDTLDPNDVVFWTTMSRPPNGEPVAWRVFTDEDGNEEGIRVSDAHKLRTVSDLDMASTSVDVVANPELPAAFRGTLPSTGVIWLTYRDPAGNGSTERIEYGALSDNGDGTLTLDGLVRGTRGTSIGVFPTGSLAVDGSDQQVYATPVPGVTDDWDVSPWDVEGWDNPNVQIQVRDDPAVDFLLAGSGTYER